MRKQYHFWPGSQGLDAWDVDRLIRLSAELPVLDVPLREIADLDVDYWYDSAHPPTARSVIEHARLILEVDTSYPILLGHDGRVMDGMHRIGRALLDGRTTIRARRFPQPLEPDHRNVKAEDLPYE